MGFLEKVFGDLNEKEVKKLSSLVEEIEALDDFMQSLSDSELKDKTEEFKNKLSEGAELDDILPEAFAVCSAACDSYPHLNPEDPQPCSPHKSVFMCICYPLYWWV